MPVIKTLIAIVIALPTVMPPTMRLLGIGVRGFIKLDSIALERSEAEIGFLQASQIQLKVNSLALSSNIRYHGCFVVPFALAGNCQLPRAGVCSHADLVPAVA